MGAPLSIPFSESPLPRDAFGHAHAPLVGLENMLARVAERLMTHGQGRILISGYSGCGKSAFAWELVRRLRAEIQNRRLVLLDVPSHNMSDSAVIGQQLVLRLHLEHERGRLPLNPRSRQNLLDAVDGVTARSVERSQSFKEELKPSIEAGGFGLAGTQSTQVDRKAVFERFDVTASLNSLRNLLFAIAAGEARNNRSLWTRLLGRERREPLIVVVLDRIPKWEMLVALSELFVTRDVVFIVAVPTTVHDRYRQQIAAGADDVPSFEDVYLPCMWDETESFVRQLLDLRTAEHEAILPDLAAYLCFEGGGIPQRYSQLLEEHAAADGKRRRLVLDARTQSGIKFCADLYRLLRRREADILGAYIGGVSGADLDRARRCAIAVVKDLLTHGSLQATEPASVLHTLHDAVRPGEREILGFSVIQVLQDEGLVVQAGDKATLSLTAREQASAAGRFLQTGFLPALPENYVASTMTMEKAASSPRQSRQSRRTCPRCSTAIESESQRFCPTCGNSLALDTGAAVPAASQAPAREDENRRLWELVREEIGEEYLLERELGRGGMSVVFLATDLHLDRRIAIKVLPPALTFGSGMLDRFRREARTAAALEHPHIVPVYRIGTSHSLFWYSMKFLDGPTLEQIIDRDGPMPLRRVVEILGNVASAVDHANAKQILHRDLKPANIQTDSLNHVYVTDFGIAKDFASGSLTSSGAVIGTPYFMSPEQCIGQPLTGAADQYSLGITAYFMISGMLPFEAESAMGIMQKQVMERPAPLIGVPAGVHGAVSRAIAKKPESRFPTSSAFVAALAVGAGL